MKTKIHMISALLALLLPTVTWGGDDHYYAALKVTVKSGEGKVYAAKSATAESSRQYTKTGNTTDTVDSTNSASGWVGSFYAYAKSDYGYRFVKWVNTSDNSENESEEYGPFTLQAAGTKNSTKTTEMQAYFEEKTHFSVGLAVPTENSAGFASYSVAGNNGYSGSQHTSAGSFKAYYDETYAFTCALKNTDVYEFDGWEVNGTKETSGTTLTKKFSAAATVRAIIKEKDHYSVTLAVPELSAGFSSYTVSGPGVSGSGLASGGSLTAYYDGTYSFTCNLSDSSVYEFVKWTITDSSGTTESTANPLSKQFTDNATVKAVLNMKEQYRLTLTKPTGVTSYAVTGPTGADGLSNGGTLNFFGTADFTFNCAIDDNYKFLNWSVTDDDGTSAPTTRTLQKRVSSNTSVAAVVAPKETYSLTLEKPEGVTSYTVTATPGGTMGSLSAGGTATVREQDSYRFECAINDVEYVFVKWLVTGANGSAIAESEERVFTTTFSSAATVTAVLYKKGVYELTFVKPEQVTSFSITGPNGAVSISEEGKVPVYELDEYQITCAFDEDNWELVNWTITDSSGESTASTLNNKTFTSDATVTPVFNKIESYIATCLAVPSGCSYKVGNETVTTAEKKVKGAKGQPLTVTLSTATAGSGYVFAGWYIENQDGSKTYLSKDSSESQTFESHVTIGADFVSASSTSKAALVVKASGGYGEYDDLKAAFDCLESGDTITICKSATLAESAGVPQGVTMTVSSGVTLTVASGQTLYVDGTVTNNGTISGTVSKCTKLIKQTGDGTDDSGKPKPFNPYGSVKYWKTAISTPSITISGVSPSSHTSIVNGYGETVYRGATANAFICSVNTSVAWNHVTGVVSTQSDGTAAYNAVSKGSGENPASQMILLTAKVTVSLGSSTNLASGFTCDGAGNVIAFSCKQMNNAAMVVVINGGSISFPQITNAKPTAINCSSVSASSVNANQSTYTSQVRLYDCSSVTLASTWPASGGVYIYSGTYTVSFKSTYHIYGGYYKNDPTSYLATGLNLVATKDSAHNNYYWVHSSIPENVAQIGDSTSSQYPTIQEAVNAVSAGQTIKLLKNYDSNETVTIASGKSFTLNLNGYAITGTSGRIINNGTLRIGDCSGGNGSCAYAIDNNGTMDVTYGTYSGTITLNSGMFTTHNGKFTGTIEFGSGVSNPADVVAIHGGMFKKSVKSLLVGDFCEITYNGLYSVGEFPYAIKSSASLSGAEKSWSLTAVSSAERTLFLKDNKARAPFSSDAEWDSYAELDSRLTPYIGFTIDCVLSFDRPVAKSSVKAYANAKVNVSDTLDRALAANESYRVLSPRVSSAGYAQISYSRFITGNDCPTTLSAGIADVNSANSGTVATIELELCHSNRTTHVLNRDYAIATCRYMLDGKKAAIDRGASRVAYNSLTAAVADVQDGETILVGADTSENVTFNNPGTYVINEYGFAFTGSATAKEGYDFAETTGTDANGFVTHTYVVSTIGPSHPADYVVIPSEHLTEWETDNGITGSSESEIREALKQNDDNGIAKWENVVMGQDGADKPAIETSTNGTETVADMVVSFKAPENTGYTVKYAFDEVNITNGEVKIEGVVTNSPALNLERITTAGTPAYFKMRAVLESNDEKHTFTTNVPVDHTVGVLKVDSSTTYTILAVPWKSFHNKDVHVSELVHAASLSENDMLHAYDDAGNLESWRVSKDGVWVKMTEQQEDGQQVETPDPASVGIARGKGVWLKRSDTSKPIYLMGMPTSDPATNTLAAATDAKTPSWNLLASPKLETVNIATGAFKDNTGDEIIVPTAGTPKHYTYKNGAWGYPGATVTEEKKLPNGQTIKVIKTEHKTDDTTVAPGTGFWYLNKGGEKTIQW